MEDASRSHPFDGWPPVWPIKDTDNKSTLHQRLDILKEGLRRAEEHFDKHPVQWTSEDLEKFEKHCTMALAYIEAHSRFQIREGVKAVLREDEVYVKGLQTKIHKHPSWDNHQGPERTVTPPTKSSDTQPPRTLGFNSQT